jgi:hypothetical protein
LIDLQDYSSPLWDTITPERREELLRWWGLSLCDDPDAPFWSIESYAHHTLPDIRFFEDALAELLRNLPRCKARNPAQFRKWCYAQIDKESARLATNEKPRHKDTKPFEPFERSGIYCIPIVDANGKEHIWKVPPDWIDDVKNLIWPVHIRWYANGRPFLARKRSFKAPGELEQKVLPAHHTYLWFKYPGISEGDIACSRARNGDFLDWTGDNLYVPAFDGLSVSEREREFRIQEKVKESSWKEFNFGTGNRDHYQLVRVPIDSKLIEEWERKLAEGTAGDRDILDVGTRSGTPEIAEQETKIKAFDTRRSWRTPSTA